MVSNIKYFAFIKKKKLNVWMSAALSSLCEKSAYHLEEIVKIALAGC